MQALVNKIIPFSSVDGPGNRTAVFLQGCNFDCKYCHNPETRNVCNHCKKCVQYCPVHALYIKDEKVCYDDSKCVHCDTCIKVCPNGASPKVKYMTPKEVYLEVEKQIPFIRGVTVSGGECMLYPQFLTEFFQLCKKDGLSTFLDSNGSIDFENQLDLLQVTDKVMLDVKAFDPKDHFNVTSASNETVLKNATYLAKIGKLYEVRTVVVPSLYDVEQTVEQAARMLAPYLNIYDIRYKLITYRPMGVRKEYAQFTVPDSKYMQNLQKIVQTEGFKNIIII